MSPANQFCPRHLFLVIGCLPMVVCLPVVRRLWLPLIPPGNRVDVPITRPKDGILTGVEHV